MLFKAGKFFQVISNELSYAAQVTNQWQELEQVSKALSRAVEERNEYKERYESEQGYINYLQGAYKEASEQRTKLEAENETLKAENEKLLGTAQALFLRFYEQYKEVEVFKAENENH